MGDNGSWETIAPEAAEPFDVFATTIRALWPKLPERGTPEAAVAELLYPVLAEEFEPVDPRRD